MTSPVASANTINTNPNPHLQVEEVQPVEIESDKSECAAAREPTVPDPRQAILERSEKLSVARIYDSPDINGPTPKSLQFDPTGRRVTFLKGKEDAYDQLDLWEYNIADGEYRLLVDSKTLAPEEELSEVERAHRERMRLFANGIVSYQWSNDGNTLLFPLNGKLYLYQLTDRTTTELPIDPKETPTDIQFSPKNRFISFVDQDNLYLFDIHTGEKKQLTTDGDGTVYNGRAEFIAEEEMNRYKGYWWSGDEKQIAFIRVNEEPVEMVKRVEIYADDVKIRDQRYPFAGTANADCELRIVNLETGNTETVPLDGYKDWYMARVCWTPDNKNVAVQMISRDQKTLDLLLVDSESRTPKVILQEKSETWINLHDDLHFLTQQNGFIWSSERSGYNHLYLYNLEGNLIRPLTKGDWKVSSFMGVNEEEGHLFFEGFATSPLEKHLYRTDILGGDDSMHQITKLPGWHQVTLAKDTCTYIDTFSNTTTPPQVSLHQASGERILFLEENRIDSSHPYFPFLATHQEREFGTIKASDGQDLHFQLTKPTHFDPDQKYPVIVTVYGGPHVQCVKNSWSSGHGGLWEQVMADRGYVIFTLDNRGSFNKGKAFEDSIHLKLGAVEVEDQKAGAEYLQELPFVDPERIGVFGWSYGGFMTLMMLFKEPGIFKTGTAVAPVTDWKDYDTCYTERYLGHPEVNSEGYENSSVFPYVHKDIGSLLLIHGMADDNVLYTNTVKLVDELQRKRVKFQMMDYPGSKHSIAGSEKRTHLFSTITDFFDEKL